MAEPIMEFKTDEELQAYLKEWQTRLFLDDWIIKAEIVPLSELPSGTVAENAYEYTLKSSDIRLGKLNNDGNKEYHELSLVHELLHLKFIFTDGGENTLECSFMARYEHMMIEQMAKSLIMAKYNIDFDWFKNF